MGAWLPRRVGVMLLMCKDTACDGVTMVQGQCRCTSTPGAVLGHVGRQGAHPPVDAMDQERRGGYSGSRPMSLDCPGEHTASGVQDIRHPACEQRLTEVCLHC